MRDVSRIEGIPISCRAGWAAVFASGDAATSDDAV
jgi:hypothetical protein